MTRVRIAGAALLVLLGAGLLTRITDHAGEPPKNPASVPLEMRTFEGRVPHSFAWFANEWASSPPQCSGITVKFQP